MTSLCRSETWHTPRPAIPTRAVDYFFLEEVADAQTLSQMRVRSQRDRRRLAVDKDGRGAAHLLERASGDHREAVIKVSSSVAVGNVGERPRAELCPTGRPT